MPLDRQTLSYSQLAKSAALVALGSVLANAAVWWLGERVSPMTIGVGEVVLGSVVGVVLGAVALMALAKLTRRPRRAFLISGVVVLALYAFGPVSAAFAPYREGAELFNLATIVATEFMHLVSGLSILWSFSTPPVLAAATAGLAPASGRSLPSV